MACLTDSAARSPASSRLPAGSCSSAAGGAAEAEPSELLTPMGQSSQSV